MTLNTRVISRRDMLYKSATAFAGVGLAGCGIEALTLSKELNSMTEQPIHYRSLTEVATQIAEGQLSSVAVTDAILARIDTLEPKLHAYYSVLADEARAKAAEADAKRDRGDALGVLHGVPIAVKDLCHKTGSITTAGHSFRRDAVSDFDSTVVSRLEASGAIIVGKLATTEGAMVGYHADFAVPRNPWGNLDRWPGVSSGGSGVGPAAGLCFASLGSDTGGSIRYPSAANGLVGMKPTWGRVSRYGVLDLAPTLDHVGPMTRTVRDAARVLGAIAGLDANDPTSLSTPVPDFEAGLDGTATGLRIGWDDAFATADVEPYVAEALRGAVATLGNLGATIVELQVPEIEPSETDAWSVMASAEAAAVHEATYPSKTDEYGTYFRQFLSSGRAQTAVELAQAVIARKNASGRIAPVFDNIDLLLIPTLASESFQYDPEAAYGGLDADTGTLAGVPLSFFQRNGRFITIWDYNGYPTLSVPCGLSPDGIPLSLQLIGKPLREAELFRAGFAYEQAHAFHLAHPDLV